jgi:hypothetical protein
MRTPTGGLRPARLLLITFAVVAATLLATPACASDQLPLHVGSSGPAVCGLKWMISGPHGHQRHRLQHESPDHRVVPIS